MPFIERDSDLVSGRRDGISIVGIGTDVCIFSLKITLLPGTLACEDANGTIQTRTRTKRKSKTDDDIRTNAFINSHILSNAYLL